MGMSERLQSWFADHARDYQAVMGRLHRSRATLLHGDSSMAADMLEKGYMFAVLSIQTEKERHERAFTSHYAGGVDRDEAALMTVYGGNKLGWIETTHEETNWENLAFAVRSHVAQDRMGDLLDTVEDNLTGVSYRKASFMLAMCGLYEFACIDSNVANYAGMEADESFRSAESYMNKCREIFDNVGVDGYPPFLIQWAIYDLERGEHARHKAFYNELPVEF